MLLTPQENFSQQKYDFDFDADWSWEDLINKSVFIDPLLIGSVNELKNKISINDARILMKHLSRLESLKDLKELYAASVSVSGKKETTSDSLLQKTFDGIKITEDFHGLIEAALKLVNIRFVRTANIENSIFEFKDRSYLPQPIKSLDREINLSFDYEGAEKVLKYFDGSSSTDEILSANAYAELFISKDAESIDKDFLINNLSAAADEQPLLSVYKWVNRGISWNLGGVSLYKKEFKDVITTIRENENNIRFDVGKNISKYLPEGFNFDAGLMFSFGKNNPGRVSGKNKLAINLEYFGDDYGYLVRYIIHSLFLLAQKEIHVPVEEFVADEEDIELIKLLSNIFEQGTANYVGPIGTETRPWTLLEKDFLLFNQTFLHIQKKDSKQVIDKLIDRGYSGNAPFYTMATQMAYIIETTLGRSALIESITLGPVYFFSRYIKAYKEYPEKIRKVFTFPESFEKKISELQLLFPEIVLKEGLQIKKFKDNPSEMSGQITRLFGTYQKPGNDLLLNFFSGLLLIEAGQFENAKEYFLKGLKDKREKRNSLGLAGEAFQNQKAYNEALDFFNIYKESYPADYRAYELRGKYFYEIGDVINAKSDFEKAASIYPGSIISTNFLKKINEQK